MTMNVGDVVNIMKCGGGYWKGKITSVTDRYTDDMIFSSPVAIVRGVNRMGHAAVREKNLLRDGDEWWEERI